MIIPEEWKNSRTARPWHRLQLGVYFLLVEDEFGIRPPHGFVVCGDGTRHRVENTSELRADVLKVAAEIRAARAAIARPIPVSPVSWQCRRCGVRRYCTQAA